MELQSRSWPLQTDLKVRKGRVIDDKDSANNLDDDDDDEGDEGRKVQRRTSSDVNLLDLEASRSHCCHVVWLNAVPHIRDAFGRLHLVVSCRHVLSLSVATQP